MKMLLKGIMQISRRGSHCLVAGLLLSVSLSTQAASLNLILQTPDIFAPYMDTNYDFGTGNFTASAPHGGGTLDGANITGESFSLTANITGGVLNSGTLTILGTSGIYNSGTLITGNLFDLGYANGGSILEFLFTPTGGDLLSAYNSSNGGIIISASGYLGIDFNTSFASAPYGAYADIAPVPIPAAVWLFGSGLLALAGFVRRR